MPRYRPTPSCSCNGTGADGCDREADPSPDDLASCAAAFEEDAAIGSPLLRAFLADQPNMRLANHTETRSERHAEPPGRGLPSPAPTTRPLNPSSDLAQLANPTPKDTKRA